MRRVAGIAKPFARRCLGVQFQEDKIVAPFAEPIDVFFRSAKFQIRELMEPNSKRGDELKEFQHGVQNATPIEGCDDTLLTATPVSFQGLVDEVAKGCRDLDARLFAQLGCRIWRSESIRR
jgi:hypothetical protein